MLFQPKTMQPRQRQAGVDGVTLKEAIPQREKMWWSYPGLRALNLLLLGAICCDVSNGYDSSMLNGLQILPQWSKYFHNPVNGNLGLINNGTRIGQVAVVPLIGPILKRFGRRMPIIYGSLLLLVGIAIQTAAQNTAMFIMGRVVLGFGNSVQQAASLVLIAEVCFPSQRAAILGIMNSTNGIGQIMAAWITFGTGRYIASEWSWRLPSLLQAASSVFQIVMAFYMPESPRWLVYNNRATEARAIIVKYHAEGNEHDDLVKFEMEEINQAIEYGKTQQSSSWAEWFRTSANIHRFFIIISLAFILQWCGNGIFSYYLHLLLNTFGIKDAKTQLYINGGQTIWGFLCGVTWSIVGERFGRRTMFLGGMTGMFIAMTILTVLTGVNTGLHFSNHAIGGASVAMIFVFYTFYKMAGVTPEPYYMEVAPYQLRAKTSAMKAFGEAGASFFNNFVNPIAMGRIGWKYYIVWCCVLVTNFLTIYFFYPETKGLSLEEVSQLFDGNEIDSSVDGKEHEFAKEQPVEFVDNIPRKA